MTDHRERIIKMKRRIYTFILAALLVLGAAVPAWGEGYTRSGYVPVTVTIDGERTAWDSGPPRLVEGITYVPLREFCSYMGEFEIAWSEESRRFSPCPKSSITTSRSRRALSPTERSSIWIRLRRRCTSSRATRWRSRISTR